MAGSNNSLAVSNKTPVPTWTDTVKKQGPKVLMGTISLAILIIGLLACLVATGQLNQYSIGKLASIPLSASATMMGVGFLWLGALCVYHFRKKEETTPAKKGGATSHPAPSKTKEAPAPASGSRLRAEVFTKSGTLLPTLSAQSLMTWHRNVDDLKPENLVQFKTFIRQQLQQAPNTFYYFEDTPARLFMSDSKGVVSYVELTESRKSDIQNGEPLPKISLLEHRSTQSRSPHPLPPLEKSTLRKWVENQNHLNDQQIGELRRFVIPQLKNHPNAFFCMPSTSADRGNVTIYQTDDDGVVTREKIRACDQHAEMSELSKTKISALDLIARLPRLTARNFGVWHENISTLSEEQFTSFKIYVNMQLEGRPNCVYCLNTKEPFKEKAGIIYYTDERGVVNAWNASDRIQAYPYYAKTRTPLETLLAKEAALPPLSMDTFWAWHASFHTLNAQQKETFIQCIHALLLKNPQTYFVGGYTVYFVEKNAETQHDEVREVVASRERRNEFEANKLYLFDVLAKKQMPPLSEDTFLIWGYFGFEKLLKPEEVVQFQNFLPRILKPYPNTFTLLRSENLMTVFLNDGKTISSKTFSKDQQAEVEAFTNGHRALDDVI